MHRGRPWSAKVRLVIPIYRLLVSNLAIAIQMYVKVVRGHLTRSVLSWVIGNAYPQSPTAASALSLEEISSLRNPPPSLPPSMIQRCPQRSWAKPRSRLTGRAKLFTILHRVEFAVFDSLPFTGCHVPLCTATHAQK